MVDVLRNLLQYGDLSFRDFVEIALYHPEFGYYAKGASPVGREGDFITGPTLSPAFSFAIGRLVREFVRRVNDAPSSIVDIGCGDGTLINTLCAEAAPNAAYFGVDRVARNDAGAGWKTCSTRFNSLADVPKNDFQLVLSNELFDALPFARLVQRGEHLHELWVTERDGALEWSEHEAAAPYEEYFASRGIALEDGQFADVSLEWAAMYDDLCRWVEHGLIVTFDYGYPQEQLFRARGPRRFGTAAAYAGHRVTRDLLANPGQQDVTAHINFGDLQHTGARRGFETLAFARQARFLLALGITEHELFKPVHELEGSSAAGVELLERRDDARRLILPDGIGEDIRVLVQARDVPLDGWSFQRALF